MRNASTITRFARAIVKKSHVHGSPRDATGRGAESELQTRHLVR